ncbi:MAG: hypothetical protein AAGU21_00260 [Solidesulfovibrio sp.]|uniref:hypothetical protein n=1 Tax=Solidesulfovibrio sp. TaxID=2910990 RepID=UPI0031588DF2
MIVRIGEGVCVGGVVGATAAVLTGAMAVSTAPAWIPVAGGSVLVTNAAMAVASSWTTIGAVIGGVVKGGISFFSAEH